MAREWFTSAQTQQLDITAKDAIRLQREVPVTTEEGNPLRQKFEIATSKGDHATQRTIERATVGVLYTRPVKKPVFTVVQSPTKGLREGQLYISTVLAINEPIASPATRPI